MSGELRLRVQTACQALGGITIKEFSELTGINYGSLRTMLSKNVAGRDTLQKLARVYGSYEWWLSAVLDSTTLTEPIQQVEHVTEPVPTLSNRIESKQSVREALGKPVPEWPAGGSDARTEFVISLSLFHQRFGQAGDSEAERLAYTALQAAIALPPRS